MTSLISRITQGAISVILFAACQNLSGDCKLLRTCAGDAGGAGADSGGASTTGSSGTGGSSGASGATGSSSTGGATADACNDECSGDTPVCNEDTSTCVECVASNDCTDTTKPVCDTSSNTCVGCMETADCTDSAAPVCNTATTTCVACLANTDCPAETASLCDTTTNACTACTGDDDCLHIEGKNVCSSGTCVQCTGTNYAACGQSAGEDLTCDSLLHTCSTSTVGSSGLCQFCTSDAQCPAGQLCYQESFGGSAVGYFCFWKQGDTANGAPSDCTLSTNRPYVRVEADAVSIDGTTATLCTLAVSTCTALNQFRLLDCAPTGTPDDNLCGFAPGVDSKCVAYGSSQYRCTTACGSDDDCKTGFTCNLGVNPNTCNL